MSNQSRRVPYAPLTHAEILRRISRGEATVAWYVAACLEGEGDFTPADTMHLRRQVASLEANLQASQARVSW